MLTMIQKTKRKYRILINKNTKISYTFYTTKNIKKHTEQEQEKQT